MCSKRWRPSGMRKRSKYRPREVLVDPVNWVVSGLRPLTTASDVMGVLRAKNHLAMKMVVEGKATRQDVDVLIEAFNITEGLCRVDWRLGRDWAQEIRAGQDALYALGRRGVELGRFVFTGPELVAANLAMEIHDVQLSKCTVAQMELAIHEVAKDVRLKRARSIVKGVSDGGA